MTAQSRTKADLAGTAGAGTTSTPGASSERGVIFRYTSSGGSVGTGSFGPVGILTVIVSAPDKGNPVVREFVRDDFRDLPPRLAAGEPAREAEDHEQHDRRAE